MKNQINAKKCTFFHTQVADLFRRNQNKKLTFLMFVKLPYRIGVYQCDRQAHYNYIKHKINKIHNIILYQTIELIFLIFYNKTHFKLGFTCGTSTQIMKNSFFKTQPWSHVIVQQDINFKPSQQKSYQYQNHAMPTYQDQHKRKTRKKISAHRA